MKKFWIICLVFSMSAVCKAQLYINEIMSNNQRTVQDEDGSYSDWIEIYNAGPSSVNLSGYYLSDNPDTLQKWRIPALVLAHDSFAVFWCSGKNRTGTNLHTNFSIDSQGETIFFTDSSLNVIDNITTVALPADITYGRLPDGSANLGYLSAPSYKATNNTATFLSGVVTAAPAFNVPGGFYIGPQLIVLSHPDTAATIRYTLDGSDPTDSSPVYSNPILIQGRSGDPNYYSLIRTCYNVHFFLPDWYPPASEVFKCSIVRARAFKPGYIPGPIKTNSYFVDPAIHTRYGNLPVVSIVSDPKNLFDDTTGIYVPGIYYQPATFFANYYKDWDRPANIEMFLPGGSRAFNGNFKISINGQSSPSSPQKGLNVNASTDYGPVRIDYPLFANTPGNARYIQKFDKIKFRAWGSDRNYALFRDAYCASFMTKTTLDIEAYRPVVVFLDGEYWGLQEMRERNRNLEYYESHYLIDKRNPGFDILDGAGNTVVEGDAVHWDAMINFINNNSMSDSANYAYIKTQMDVDNFMLNFMSSIYLARGDWPGQNEGKWRPRIPGGKWKWMQWDMDNTVAYYLNPWYNMFTQALSGSRGYGPSELLDSLMVNTEFKNNFINLFADFMNTKFLSALAQARVDEMSNQLMPYFTEYQDRWQVNYNWQHQLDSMKWWMDLRPLFVKQQIVDTFGLAGVRNLQLDVSDTAKGYVRVNTILLDANTPRTNAATYPWTGQYFDGVPVPLKAIARPGYKFLSWLPINDTNPEISIDLLSDTSLTAWFDVDPDYHQLSQPVINEAMSSNLSAVADNYGEFDDWIEIYNPNSDTLDLAGYYLTDNLVLTTRFRFSPGSDSTRIAPYGFLLVWIDDDTEQGLLHANFKFNASGDFIALIASDGETLVDSITIHALPPDVSYGRVYDAALQFTNFQPSTPGATNAVTVIPENLLINELQTMNFSTVQDNYGEYNPWIEIYNPNSDTVDLAGWKITNDTTHTVYYVFPNNNDSTKIPPDGFRLLWADYDNSQGIFHLNFSLAQTGCIWLFKPQDILSDSVCYPSPGLDHSYGRVTDGNPSWRMFTIPTPDSNNADLTVGIIKAEYASGLFAFPNPLYGSKLFFNKEITFSIYDLPGRPLGYAVKARFFDMTGFERGIYIIRTKEGEIIKVVKN